MLFFQENWQTKETLHRFCNNKAHLLEHFFSTDIVQVKQIKKNDFFPRFKLIQNASSFYSVCFIASPSSMQSWLSRDDDLLDCDMSLFIPHPISVQLGLLVLLVPSVEVPDFQLDIGFRNFLLWVDVHTDSHPST